MKKRKVNSVSAFAYIVESMQEQLGMADMNQMQNRTLQADERALMQNMIHMLYEERLITIEEEMDAQRLLEAGEW